MRVLVAYDGSEGAGAVVSDLARAGLPPSVEAVVVSVADVISIPPGPADVDPATPDWLAAAMRQAHAERLAVIEAARAKAESGAEAIRRAFPSWTVRAEAFGDSPAWGIIKRADEWKPALVVVGSRGGSAVSRLVLGSVSHKVLNAVHCSVRIARKGAAGSRGAPRLLVGVDGSRHAWRAVQGMCERAWPQGTKVRVVAAFDAFMASAVALPPDEIQQWVRDAADAETWAHRMVEAAVAELATAGLAAEGVVVQGDPKVVLVREAKSAKADCIFLGSQGLNAVERALLGSVSSSVATNASCSVEVVRG